MDRNSISVAAAVLAVIFSSCAGKEIPDPLVTEPEPARIATTEGSLWPGETPQNMLFSDNKATRAGDIITVHLVERTTASNKAATRLKREKKTGFGFSTQSLPAAATGTKMGLAGENSFNGSGSTNRSETLISTISATVIEVLPNGTMKIDGRRQLKMNNADQYIRVTGLVRKEDINYDNSILSTKIANAEISYDGVGDLDRHQRSGWLGRALTKIWPF
ncbi:MAG: flagellar basal body L-ring protein FlgH [Nitrospinota bacterium]